MTTKTDQNATEGISDSDLALAEALLARGNDLKTIAALLSVDSSALAPIEEKGNAMADLKKGYEQGSPDQTFGEWCEQFITDDYPDNPLELNIDKTYLSVSGIARKEGWIKGLFKSSQPNQGSGRPRVDNSEEKLMEAAKNAKARAETDRKKNLKLCVVEAMADVGVTDLNGVIKHCQSIGPEHWKPRS